MMMYSASLYAAAPSVVAFRFKSLVVRYSSISLSMIGDFLLLIISAFS